MCLDSLPVNVTRVVAPPAETDRGESHVLGVLLAAGASTRYGAANKLLATLDGDPVVRRALDSLVAGGVDDVLAVVGFEADRVADALGDVAVVRNDDWQDGIGTAVSRGAREATASEADAVVFALGDMPWVDPDSVTALLNAAHVGMASALAAAYRGQRGNPVLFDRQHFETLAALDGATGGAAVFDAAEDSALVETGDPGVCRDIDRPGDLDASRRERRQDS